MNDKYDFDEMILQLTWITSLVKIINKKFFNHFDKAIWNEKISYDINQYSELHDLCMNYYDLTNTMNIIEYMLTEIIDLHEKFLS